MGVGGGPCLDGGCPGGGPESADRLEVVLWVRGDSHQQEQLGACDQRAQHLGQLRVSHRQELGAA